MTEGRVAAARPWFDHSVVRSGTIVRVAVAFLFLCVIVVSGLSMWSWGVYHGFLAALVLIVLFAFPGWALLSLTDPPDVWWAPTPRARARVMVVLAIVTILTGIGAALDMVTDLSTGQAVVIGLGAALLILVPSYLVVVSLTWPLRPREDLLTESTMARGALLMVFGIAGGALAMLLLAAPFLAFIEPQMPWAEGFDGSTEFYAWGLFTVMTLGAHLPAVWVLGFSYTGFLLLGHARARLRRHDALEGFRARLDDHYALRRVTPPTYEALRDSLRTERNGLVPGEAEYVQSKAALLRCALLGGLGLVVALMALLSTPQGLALMTHPDGPCHDCTEAEWAVHEANVQTWGDWAYGLGTVALVAGGAFLLLVPHLVLRIRAARAQAVAFWTERDQLEARMLEEVRAATPEPR